MKRKTASDQPLSCNIEEWKKARMELLVKEKELTRLKDEVAKARRQLPWIKVDKEYTFTDSATGKKLKLSGLFDGFQNGKDTLVVVHFMFAPDWEKPCQSCSFWADTYDGALHHFLQKANFVVVARAAADKLKETAKVKDWKFPFLSSSGEENTFNSDFDVEFSKEDIAKKERKYNFTSSFLMEQSPGWSVFHKDSNTGDIYRTYSTYGRGLDILNAPYQWMDLLPNGREEEGLSFSMAWVKHKEDY